MLRHHVSSFNPREPGLGLSSRFAEKLGDFKPIHWRRRALVSRMQQALSENESERRSLNFSAHCSGLMVCFGEVPAGKVTDDLIGFA